MIENNDALLAKQVIVEIVRCAGGRLTGRLKLYKAFYFAHLIFAERASGYLTNWPIVRMPNGPGIDSGATLIRELSLEGRLKLEATKTGPFRTTTFCVAEESLPGEGLPPLAIDAIREAVEFVQARNATELSELTHENSRSWNAAKEGDRLNIYLDNIPNDEFDDRNSELDALESALSAGWN